ncbi:hypothetical protein [Candidatus Karelsulcia muelleri]|uniref:hypothetical protein n=1 Tax=Candidatus Karelsulcia muelleri TaxID=336810 RepID=UPI00194F7791|nr:hypothetical protein [Candidatus Karelsulcia muelleri]
MISKNSKEDFLRIIIKTHTQNYNNNKNKTKEKYKSQDKYKDKYKYKDKDKYPHKECKIILNMLEVQPLTLILKKIYKLYLEKFLNYKNKEEKFKKIANLVFILKEADKKNKSYFLKKEEIMKELISKICQIEKEKYLIV